MNLHELDTAFPTIVRYCGLLLVFLLLFASIIGYGLEVAAGWPAAAGMMLYKTVRNAASGNGAV